MRVHRYSTLVPALLLWICAGTATAQTLRLRAANSPANSLTVQVGDTLAIDVIANLSNLSVSGAQLFIGIPDGPFEIVAERTSPQEDIRPFRQGPLLDGAMEFSNELMPGDEVPDLFDDLQLLTYAAVLGPGKNRGRTGSGTVATFHLLCTHPATAARVHIAGNPIYQTFLVLDDGYGERAFQTTQDLEITVEPPTQSTPSPSKPAEGNPTWGALKTRFSRR